MQRRQFLAAQTLIDESPRCCAHELGRRAGPDWANSRPITALPCTAPDTVAMGGDALSDEQGGRAEALQQLAAACH